MNPEGFEPYESGGIRTLCIQRGSSPMNPEGFEPYESGGVRLCIQRDSNPMNPEEFDPYESRGSPPPSHPVSPPHIRGTPPPRPIRSLKAGRSHPSCDSPSTL